MSIEVGNKLTGKVTGITNFGAFVDLGNRKTGLVHISEVALNYVKDINEVLTVGDEVTVKVTAIADDGKISLSIRQAIDKPETTEKPARPKRPQTDDAPKRKQTSNHSTVKPSPKAPSQNKAEDFDALMSAFLKDSDDRLLALKRNTEGKRGGRGGRRS